MTRGYDMSLTDKQARFAEEYLLDLNGKQAAIRAGYSEDTAEQQAARLLRNVKVAAAIAAGQAARSERTQVTADRVLRELADLAFFDPADLVRIPIEGPTDLAKRSERVRRAVLGWGWDKHGNFTLKLSNKLSALIECGRHIGISQKVEHSGDALTALLAEIDGK